ncbi:hypothetical protein C804_01122 [Lachnospiraceae bacterium A4]|jgi:hypothetical protein|nr:hypothetical protein C804_01122 [Lachnospiraceae bacterium A4]
MKKTKRKKSNLKLKKIIKLITVIASVMTIIVGVYTLVNTKTSDDYIQKNSGNGIIIHGDGDNTINVVDNHRLKESSTNKDSINTEYNANININNLKLDYAILSDDRFKNVYIKDYTDLSEDKEKYYFEENCVFILNISNPTDHEVKVNKFSIVANNIIPISQPYISVSLCTDYEKIFLTVCNHGWSNAYNIELLIKDTENILSKYFNAEDLIVRIPKLQASDSITVEFLDNNKVIKFPDISENEYITIRPFCEVKIDEIVQDSQNLCQVYLYNNKTEIDAIGGNEGFYGVYGIMINANLNKDRIEYYVNEIIPPGKILDIPICFFPNKSCNMEFYTEFNIFNGFDEKIISSEVRNVQFKISSINSHYINIDNKTFDLQHISGIENDYYISYPDNKEINRK